MWVMYVAPSLDPSQWPGELAPRGCEKQKKKKKEVLVNVSVLLLTWKLDPGACSGLGWRKPRGKRSISIPLVPCPTPPSLSFYCLRLGLCLDFIQQKHDLSSGKAFLSVMLLMNHFPWFAWLLSRDWRLCAGYCRKTLLITVGKQSS